VLRGGLGTGFAVHISPDIVVDEAPHQSDPATRAFYLHALSILDQARIPHCVAGGYAMTYYTGIARRTKDLDICIRADDSNRSLDVLAAAGYRTERTWPHFLVKALSGEAFVDLLYSSGNGLCPVDDEWFAHSVRGEVLGQAAPICPPEEMIWSKAFVQERDRFDGADIAHLILNRGDRFDWARLMRRFDGHHCVLLAHLLLFTYIYPGRRDQVPPWVLDELWSRGRAESPKNGHICRGTNLSQIQYLFDIHQGGFADARLKPQGTLTNEDVARFLPR
jgi:hypothetical protein